MCLWARRAAVPIFERVHDGVGERTALLFSAPLCYRAYASGCICGFCCIKFLKEHLHAQLGDERHQHRGKRGEVLDQRAAVLQRG